MRAVLDPNVFISALLSRSGAPAQGVARWVAGDFELVVSELLLAELGRALGYPKVRTLVPAADAAGFLALLRHAAVVAPDPSALSLRSPDPGDEHLLALAESERAMLVSGDRHLIGLAGFLPIRTPRAFLEALEEEI
ncbi:MAG: putative toxin-antitoxin system toxin component, PIN family [Gaiellaceae bacterium]